MGRERLIDLTFEGDDVAHRVVNVVTREMAPIERVIILDDPTRQPVFGAEFTFTAAPTRPIVGVVVDAATGDPLPGVHVESYGLAGHPIGEWRVLKTVTDRQGRYRLVGMPKGAGNRLIAVPNDKQPYFIREAEVPDPVGLGPVAVRFELHRGIWITGRVTDNATGEPAPGVSMYYFPLRSNEFAQAIPEFHDSGLVDGDQRRTSTKTDGTFRFVGLPGRAIVGAESILTAYRTGAGYQEIDAPKHPRFDRFLTYVNLFNPGAKWPSVMREIDPSADADSAKIDLQLEPGASVRLRMVDEDGKPVIGAEVNGLKPRLDDPATNDAVRTVVNLGPNETRHVIIHHKQRNIGRVVSGRSEARSPRARSPSCYCRARRSSGRLVNSEEPIGRTGVPSPNVLPGGDLGYQFIAGREHPMAEGRFAYTLLPGCDYTDPCHGRRSGRIRDDRGRAFDQAG